MKLEKYEDKSKKRKIILISISVILLVSVSLLLYKTFANFSEEVEFDVMKGQVDYFGNSDIYFVFYQGDKELEEMPKKDNKENLVFDHAECDNGASIEWNKEEWGPIVKNLSKSKTKCSLYFDYPTAVEYFTELAKTNSINLKADDTDEANIRYIGGKPNNYIDIGDGGLWRVIGVMNNITNLDNAGRKESLVKIRIANRLGLYSWDSSAEGINSGYGVNEWSEADLMKLLNPQEVYNGTPVIGGSLYWDKGSGNCYSGNKETNKTCDFTSSGISETAREKIAKVRWNTGTAGEPYDTSKYTAKYMYKGERSSHNGKEQCKSAGGSICDDKVERKTTWDGYLGLIYLSDYGYAVGGSVRDACLGKSMYEYSDCIANDWLTAEAWTMTTVPYTTASNFAFIVSSSGIAGSADCDMADGIYPVGYLKSSIKITGGTGEIGSPFIATLN